MSLPYKTGEPLDNQPPIGCALLPADMAPSITLSPFPHACLPWKVKVMLPTSETLSHLCRQAQLLSAGGNRSHDHSIRDGGPSMAASAFSFRACSAREGTADGRAMLREYKMITDVLLAESVVDTDGFIDRGTSPTVDARLQKVVDHQIKRMGVYTDSWLVS